MIPELEGGAPTGQNQSQRQRTRVPALHKPILRTLYQSTLYWVSVNVEQLLHAFLPAPDVEIVIVRNPLT